MFSVVVPVYNHGLFLEEAVCSALRSPLVTEVLLLDDGSTDESPSIAAQLAVNHTRVRDLTRGYGENLGASRRLNELVQAAACEWIAVLNSDDAFVAGRFEAMIDHPRFSRSEFIFGNLRFMNENSELVGAKRGPFETDSPFPGSFDVAAMVAEGRFVDLLAHQNFLGSTSNMVFRKGVHARVGGFRSYRYVHDWDFALRAARASSLLYLDRHVTIYRFHSANTISENPGGVAQEVRKLFANFAVDFPGQDSTEAFRAALEKNPFLRGSTTAQSDDPTSSNGGSSAHRSIRAGANVVAPLKRNGSAAMEVGICGTFDVANYGDLLFPLIADAELKKRLGPVTVRAFSYHNKSAPDWPFDVASITRLPQMLDRLDGLLIGGGHLIRFDKDVAPGYAPPSRDIHHPTGYWLSPALAALHRGVPVIWNAPSGGNDIPDWARPLLESALSHSRYISVRDDATRAAIEPLVHTAVSVVPDTAFGLPGLLHLNEPPSAELRQLYDLAALDCAYIVVQPAPEMEAFVRFVKKHRQRFQHLRVVVLPIGPVLGERQESIDADPPFIVHLPTWPRPLVMAELIGRAQGAAGISYHLSVSALASGIPVFRPANRFEGKYGGLRAFDGIVEFPEDGEIDPDWFLARLGPAAPCAAARAASQSLETHWDCVAAAIRAGREPARPPLKCFWFSLPASLEGVAERDRSVAALSGQLDESSRKVEEAHAAIGFVSRALEESRVETAALTLSLQESQTEAAALTLRLQESHAETAALTLRLQESHAETAAFTLRLQESHADTAALTLRLQESHAETAALTLRLQESHAETAALKLPLQESSAALGEREARIADLESSLSWRLTAPLRLAGRPFVRQDRCLIDLNRIRKHRLEMDPFRWAFITGLFRRADAERLVETYPRDHFKPVASYGGERTYDYEARPFIRMGASVISFLEELSDAWRGLGRDLLSPRYREAISALTGHDLAHVPMEVNVFHYGPGGCLDAHRDLPEKLVTHVLYFNRSWNTAAGGCLRILRSSDTEDVKAEILPIVGNSAIIVRSENSWHCVSRVVNAVASSRCSITVTFYKPGSISTMWPPADTTPLRRYPGPDPN